MKLSCQGCGWEKALQTVQDVSPCPTCHNADNLYLVAEYPACHICGEQTKPSSGSNLGATWDCPNGHYREVLSKNEGRYYLSNGERHSIDQAPDAEFGAALLKLKE